MVVTHLYQGQALADWRRESGRLLAFALPVLLTLGYLATALYRKDRRQAQRDRKQLALFFFDLDKFKPVNDQLGHAVGDLLLQARARRLQEVVRSVDTLARLGGNRFAIYQGAEGKGKNA